MAFELKGKVALITGAASGIARETSRLFAVQGADIVVADRDLNGAENQFKAALANDPNYQTAIAEMGEVRYHQGRWSDAAEQLAKSRTMTPELLYMLCDSYFHAGKVSDADLTAETVAAYARNKPEVMKDLNDLLLRNGQTELAQRLSANLAQK